MRPVAGSGSIEPEVTYNGTYTAYGIKQMYSELRTKSNFSFLRGASHPEELISQAAALGLEAIALTDLHSFAGIVRAHIAAKECSIRFITGVELKLYFSEEEFQSDNFISLLAYPTNTESYGKLCQLISKGKSRGDKDLCLLTIKDFIALKHSVHTVFIPPLDEKFVFLKQERLDLFEKFCKEIIDNHKDRNLFSLALSRNYSHQDQQYLELSAKIANNLGIPLVANNNVFYHIPERKALFDIVNCIRLKKIISEAGYLLGSNSERCLKNTTEIQRLFQNFPRAVKRSIEITEQTANFSLDNLRYHYPAKICPSNKSPDSYLAELSWQGAKERYPDEVPNKVKLTLLDELKLIKELDYAKYFLTCFDIVKFARSRNILCQGRGAAANSAVCFCLGITSVDPTKIDLLFSRFVSKSRKEPPDIDIDFEHERREEVIQYIYNNYGRDKAALTAAITTYKARSAVRDVGKALGLSLDTVDTLAKALHRWTGCNLSTEDLQEMGLNPAEPGIWNTLLFCQLLKGFPRHITQHVGGFIISQNPLTELVPIIPAAMQGRSTIEWDKNDIEALGILKIDILALGMLTCIRKAIELINRHYKDQFVEELTFANIPAEDSQVYDMLCKADSLGVFQVESRAQMSMLPRLKPRCFYDLVIEVAIVRPGPIHGDMVHPFLRRRSGEEKVSYPDNEVKSILEKTLGVPIFQEQAMRLAIVLANFTPDEAEELRKAMAAWKSNKIKIKTFQDRIYTGMLSRGYSKEFATSCIDQLKGFSEYGFPESHAASFAYIVYVSAWIKCHYPDVFAAALLNSQPMGFYAPAQIIADARAHKVSVRQLSVNHSEWDCTLDKPGALRTGLRLIKSIHMLQGERLVQIVRSKGPFRTIAELWQASLEESFLPLYKHTLLALAKADVFANLNLSRREALWQIHALPEKPTPLDLKIKTKKTDNKLPGMSLQMNMFKDYTTTGFSLKAHPMQFIRKDLKKNNFLKACELRELTEKGIQKQVNTAGVVLFKQRPGTSKGVVFLTLEDESGSFNVVVLPHIFEQFSKTILSANAMAIYGKLEKFKEPVYICASQINELQMQNTSLARSWSY